MPKLFHTPKSQIIGPLFILPLFLYFSYEGIVHSDYLLAIGSIVIWLLIVLFTINYWFQAVVIFIGIIVAFYFGYWQAGILLVLLFMYMVNAARLAERGELVNLGVLKNKHPMVEQIIDLLQDKKKMRLVIIILAVFGLLAIFISMQLIKP